MDRWNVSKTTWGSWIAFTFNGRFAEFGEWQDAYSYASEAADRG